jgi:hypothetical protein
MQRELILQPPALETLARLEAEDEKKLLKVRKTLGLMEANIRHPGLKTHKYHGLTGENAEEVWEAYVENNTPSAYRVFWHYGPGQAIITVIAITPHP